jgi:hypothetical protein
VYLISRLDLPRNHLTVQAAHAAIAATLTYGQPGRTHPHLVVCAVKDEVELEAAFEKLKESGVPVVAYREDDMGDALTAVCTAPLMGEERRPLKRFRLLPG